MIIGMNIRAIEASRADRIAGNLQISNVPRVKGVNVRKVEAIKKEALDIEFDYTCTYLAEKKEVGKIKMVGSVLYATPQRKKILDSWKKKKGLPGDVSVAVINAIMRRCITQAVGLAADLGLPPPIQFPVARARA
jgi:hypothetical protein